MKKTKRAARKRTPKREAKREAQGPEKPFNLNISGTLWTLLALLLIFAIAIIYFMSQPIQKPVSVSYHDPLSPVVGLQLLPGERYIYELKSTTLESMRMEHVVEGRKGNCIMVTTTSKNTTFPSCLDDKTGEPISLGDPQYGSLNVSPQFSQPWMLSVKEGWNWYININTTMEVMGASEIVKLESTYSVDGKDKIKGRDAYKVVVDSTVSTTSGTRTYERDRRTDVLWIDAEKRVLLYTASKDTSLELVSAPFPIEQYAGRG